MGVLLSLLSCTQPEPSLPPSSRTIHFQLCVAGEECQQTRERDYDSKQEFENNHINYTQKDITQ
jgi:hypothetical protein